MFKNYLKVAFRVLLRQKQYVLITTFGLAIGLAVSLLIIGFISNELRFEHCHEKSERIYRVDGSYQFRDSGVSMASIMPAAGPALAENLPEVEHAVRVRRLWDIPIEFGFNDAIVERKVFAAEPSLFNIFTMPLKEGDSESALNAPFSIVISEDVSRNHFADQSPLGKTIKLMDEYEFQITGVTDRISANTQIRSDFIISYATLEKIGEDVESWTNILQDYTYLLLLEGSDPNEVEQNIPAVLELYLEPDEAKMFNLKLQPLGEIYLHSNLSYELTPDGDLTIIYVFSWIAALILIIACINFINLATAKTSHRIKEVGVRKVLGAFRGQLVKQFIGESLILTLVAMLLGIAIFEISIPFLENFLGRELAINILQDPYLVGSIAGMILVVGLFSGSYPAFILSKFRPSDVLRGSSPGGTAGSLLRKILVVVQFTIALTLLCTTFALYNQISYSITTDLGFDKDSVILINLDDDISNKKYRVLQSEISSSNSVKASTITQCVPGENRYNLYSIRPENKSDQDPTLINCFSADADFLSTFNLTLIKGTDFLDEHIPANNPVIINEAAAVEYEIYNPIGFKLLASKTEYNIIGVVKDFHIHSLHTEIMPCMIRLNLDPHRLMAVRLNPENIPESISNVEDNWKRIFPELPFDYAFLNEAIKENYNDEEKIGTLLSSFSLIAVFVACLGLFGLASFTAERRTKEIGVRKVLGATIANIIALMSQETLILVVIANLIGWPVAYFVLDRALNEFAYRATFGWSMYVLAGAIVMFIALTTVGFQSLKAAIANPVDALKHE
ncbi:MAG: FtsX-like permease family protein [candidate division Zixibacteria bacterium]|nr:FtsX-like permease family protein [candidate division Zixibacteria bacterium]